MGIEGCALNVAQYEDMETDAGSKTGISSVTKTSSGEIVAEALLDDEVTTKEVLAGAGTR